ncbi:hypothetical protein PQX77_000567 [Marasmius sp. AFHP31]|nr:hypothetical protein PQX77_000567 [Marasmius sp. AFHP31]
MSSVASKNPFALLDDAAGDDGAAAAPAKAPASAAAPAPQKKEQQKPRSTGPASRGGKYYQRGGARSAGTRDGNPNQNGIEDSDAPRKFEGRGRGGRGGRGGPRGGGGGGGGRRAFDRHSATGKTDSEKKVHQGWGGDEGKTELQAEEAASKDAAAESAAPTGDWDATATADAWGATADAAAEGAADAATGDKAEGRPRREPEEEDNTLTLDQYLAQQKDKDTIVPKLEPRKIEGDGTWKDAVPLQKGAEEDAYFVGKTKAAPKAKAKKEEKIYLEIDGRFERPSRGGRGRGGDRGGDRGGRGRGGRGGRGGRSNGPNAAPAAVNVDDEAAFPSLS